MRDASERYAELLPTGGAVFQFAVPARLPLYKKDNVDFGTTLYPVGPRNQRKEPYTLGAAYAFNVFRATNKEQEYVAALAAKWAAQRDGQLLIARLAGVPVSNRAVVEFGGLQPGVLEGRDLLAVHRGAALLRAVPQLPEVPGLLQLAQRPAPARVEGRGVAPGGDGRGRAPVPAAPGRESARCDRGAAGRAPRREARPVSAGSPAGRVFRAAIVGAGRKAGPIDDELPAGDRSWLQPWGHASAYHALPSAASSPPPTSTPRSWPPSASATAFRRRPLRRLPGADRPRAARPAEHHDARAAARRDRRLRRRARGQGHLLREGAGLLAGGGRPHAARPAGGTAWPSTSGPAGATGPATAPCASWRKPGSWARCCSTSSTGAPTR